MQAIASDLERSLKMMKTDDSKAQTLSELMGYDVDSTYRQPINFIQSASRNECSISGISVTQGDTVTINIGDDNVLLSTRRSCIVMDITIPAVRLLPDNCLAFFQPTSIELGKLKWTVGSGQYLLQQYLHSQPTEAVSKVQGGLLLDFRAMQTPLDTGVEVLQGGAVALPPFARIQGQKNNFALYKQSKANTVRVCIPLEWLWPELRETFGFDGLIYLGLGQKLVLTANLQHIDSFMNPKAASDKGADTYSITNTNLIKVLTNLDSDRQSLILRSVLPLQKVDFSSLEAPMGNSVIFNFNINDKQRAQKLYIAHHYDKSIPAQAVAHQTIEADGGNHFAKSFTADTAANKNCSGYKNMTTYFPRIHRDLTMIQISFGGIHRVLTQQMISSLADSQAVMFQDVLNKIDPLYEAAHSVLVIDLSRFQHDMIGSSSGSQVAIQVTCTYQHGTNFIMPGQVFVQDNQANFRVRAYLQTGSQAVLENGLYSMV